MRVVSEGLAGDVRVGVAVRDWSNLAVTTHIIGKPPAPKGGATFGDVPDTKDRDSLCLRRDGCLIARIEERAAVNAPGVHVNARHIPSGAEFWLDYDEPVTLLSVQPRDPEPDPAVTTYGEPEPGEFFAEGPQVDEQDREGLHLRGRGDAIATAHKLSPAVIDQWEAEQDGGDS